MPERWRTCGPWRATAFAVALGCAFAGPCPASEREPVSPAVAIAAEVTADGARTRLALTLSRPVSSTTFLLEKPDRVVIDLPEVNFQLGPDTARRRGGVVTSLRAGLFAPGRSRIVVELGAPAIVAKVDMTEGPAPGAATLTLEFARTDREAFRRLVAADRTDLVLTTGSLTPGSAAGHRPVVAIDAGHGGIDPGATAANGTLEKDITFAFAETLRDRLAGSGRYRLLMIRDHDTFVPLEERVRRAREAGADLFISIHADTIASSHVSGGTIYTGSEAASDVESASLADRENAADAAGGVLRGPADGEVADILHELTARETRGFSGRFSKLLLRDLSPVMRFTAQPQREAGFRVLRSPDLPSVLVELGYLSNARDLDLMLSPEWRKRIAGAMAGAVDRFFSARTASRAPMSP